MFISLALLVRTTTKMKSRKIENYENRISNLEMELRMMRNYKEENKRADY